MSEAGRRARGVVPPRRAPRAAGRVLRNPLGAVSAAVLLVFVVAVVLAPVLSPLDPNAVLMTGRFILSGGEEAEQSGWFTLVWARTPEGWRVIHDHSS